MQVGLSRIPHFASVYSFRVRREEENPNNSAKPHQLPSFSARKERPVRRFLDTFLLLSGLLLAGITSAQHASTTAVPNLIRYGGTLKDADGAPIAATAGVTFAIYKQQDGGAPVWMETQNVTPDASGQYSVLAGQHDSHRIAERTVFARRAALAGRAGARTSPSSRRVLLVSVPYALKAHEAETLAGKSISDFVLAKDLNSPRPRLARVPAKPGLPEAFASAAARDQDRSRQCGSDQLQRRDCRPDRARLRKPEPDAESTLPLPAQTYIECGGGHHTRGGRSHLRPCFDDVRRRAMA